MNFTDEAIKMAGRSTIPRHMTGCVILDPNEKEIISTGWSHVGTWRMRELYSMHAEHHALLRARHLNLTNCKALIATIARKSGNPANSAPCISCATALISAGIDVAYCTSGDISVRMEHEFRPSWREINMQDELASFKTYAKPE